MSCFNLYLLHLRDTQRLTLETQGENNRVGNESCTFRVGFHQSAPPPSQVPTSPVMLAFLRCSVHVLNSH